MQFANIFSSGMNKDLSRDLIKSTYYFDAQNMTLITDNGQSTGSIQNTKGNLFSIKLPDNIAGQNTSNVSEVIIDPNGTSGSVNINITVLPSGTSTLVTASYTDDEADFYTNAADTINAALNTSGVYAAYSEGHLVVWSGLDVSNNLIHSNISISCTVTSGSGVTTVNNTYVPAQGQLNWIGWGRIRDTFFLFSTNETTNASPTNSYGQIWQFEYDKLTFYYKLTLLYNNQINFTNFHPIPNPGGFIGNYETDNIQKIYWTDNYNRLRIINTIDPNLFALLPDEIEIYPDVALSIPILQSITPGGQLAKGIWQCSYRLKNTTGSVTNFSTPSNPVFLVGYFENDIMIDFQTDDPFNGLHSGKTVTFKIDNIDTSYDRIEVVALFRNTIGQTPTVQLVIDEPISGNSTFTATFTGNQNPVDITIDEFQAEPLIFDTIKTIQAKNNYLFAGNVKYSDFDVNFDARAYRYDRLGNTYTDPDDINPEQSPGAQGDLMAGRFLFQSNGTVYGGTGPNVSYRFTRPDFTTAANGDYAMVIDNSYTGIGVQATAPYFEVYPNSNNQNVDLLTDFQQYPNPFTYPDYHSPYLASAIKQYKRDEIYRFGIVFFSTKGEPSYVHWIADIRMPHTYMPRAGSATVNRAPLGAAFDNYFPITRGQNGVIYANPLGVEFTVDVSSIQDQISGFQIVRVKRENSDKTILGQGMLYPAISDGGEDFTVPDTPDQAFQVGQSISTTMSSFNCPDFLFRGSPRHQSGDFFDYIGLMRLYMNTSIVWGQNGTVSSSFLRVIKYQSDNTGTQCQQITDSGPFIANGVNYQPLIAGTAPVNAARLYDSQSAGGGGDVNFQNYFSGTIPGTNVYNASSADAASGAFPPSLGSKTLLSLVTFTDGTVGGDAAYRANVFTGGDDVLGTATNGDAQYLANYKRNLPSQYGGNTNSAKSRNEYISTGHYQPVDDIHTGTVPGTYVYTGVVFGGDTYIAMFDNIKQFPRTSNSLNSYNWDPTAGSVDTCSAVHICPMETDINYNLRYSTQNKVANKYQPSYDINDTTKIDCDEDFLLQPFIDMENDVKIFVPRPDPFVDRTNYDVRVFASQKKTNGELNDSWGIFKQDDYLDLDSLQGPLNNLIVHKDKLLGYQDQGISNLPVNERSLIQDQTGAELTLGTGGVLPRYDYISKKIGSRHQFGFTQSADAVFFFDMNSKSLYKQIDTSPESISLIKGLSSWFKQNLNGVIQTEDNPFRRAGITSTYDFKDNEAVITFIDKIPDVIYTVSVISSVVNNVFTVQFPLNVIINLTVGEEVYFQFLDSNNNTISILCTVTAFTFGPPSVATLQAQGIVQLDSLPLLAGVSQLIEVPFTVAYNDFIDAFTSFYSFHPSMYVSDQLYYFTPSTFRSDLWIHKRGDYGRFYGGIPANSSVSFIINPEYPKTKRFNSYQMITEVYNSNQEEQLQETFNEIRLYNTNQNTDWQTLPIDPVTGSISQTGAIAPRGPKEIARRVENQWNLSYLFDRVLYTVPNPDIFTDLSTPNEIQFAQRLRSKFLICDLLYNNANNNNIILRNFITNYDVSPR